MIIPSDIHNSLTQAFILTASSHNEKIRQGTQMLMNLRQDVLYPKVLLDYFSSTVDIASALRAAIEFKLWFQSYKDFADYEYNVVAQSVEIVKSQIIHVYLHAQIKISNMIQDAILAIAYRDFPNNWNNLMSQLVPVLDPTQHTPEQTLRVLKLLRKMFVKYEYSSRSDLLYIEIIHVCDVSHDSLLKLTTMILTNIQTQQGDLGIQFKILKSLLRVFYYLNFQDLHPHFEDNLQTWMKILQTVLQIQPTSHPNDTFKCKGEALRAVLLYSTKYREDFESLIQIFSQEIWAVCTNANNDPAFDKIVHNALRYFKSLVAWQDMKPFFQSNMSQLMDNLILKNMQISKLDQINFEEEPQTFIEAYFENSDLESRRAQTVELFKSLGKYYKESVTQILTNSIQQHLLSVCNNQIDFQNEVLQINLVIDGLVVAYTSKDGAIDIQLDSQIPLTFYDQVIKKRLGDLYQLGQQQQPLDSVVPPIVLAFYCRFLFVYRNIIPSNEIISIAQVVSKMAVSKHSTLAKVACYTVEALLTIKKGDLKTYQNLQPLFTKDNIGDSINPLLADIYESAKSQLEQYSLRCISVILSLMKEKALMSADALSIMFLNQLVLINDGFDFQNALLVFECIGTFLLSALNVNDNQAAFKFSNKVLPILDQMLRENKGDISAFVLQIYSLLVLTIDINDKQHEDYFGSIFKSFLVLDNWSEQNQSLFPAYILYFEGWLQKRTLQQAELQALQIILAQVIQYSGQSFTSLADMLLGIDQMWVPFILQQIFKQYQINIEQMQNSQTPQSFSKSKQGSIQQRMINKEAFLTLANINQKFGVSSLIEQCYKISPGLLENFLMNEVVIVRSIQNRQEKRQIFIMLTQLLFESQLKLSLQSWQVVFQSMIENFTLKRKVALRMHFREALAPNQITSSSGFQKLQALQQIKDKQQPIIDEEKYFGQKFQQFYSNPDVQAQINIQSLINTHQQEILTQIIQNV